MMLQIPAVLGYVAAVPLAAAVTTSNWMSQSWFFDWNVPGSPFPVPTTAQCETIHITWQRGAATGPDGIAPYYLQIYTSNYIFPFIIPAGPNPRADVTIPFAPGTLYQICMFDSNGNTGGCQDVYTVYPNPNTTATCANFTMPSTILDAKLSSSSGPLSMFGWIPSCTDLQVTPVNGTPPFTLTVAPSLHPPLNITSNSMAPINWTVSLSWASSFFVSLVDTHGVTWSNGLLHSAQGDIECLSMTPASNKKTLSIGIAAGTAAGALILGATLSALVTRFFLRRQMRSMKKPRPASRGVLGDSSDHIQPYTVPDRVPTTPSHMHRPSREGLLSPGAVTPNSSASSKQRQREYSQFTSPSSHALPQHYETEVFQPESNRGAAAGSSHPLSPVRPRSASSNSMDERESQSVSQDNGGQVYVIHHDSGRAPVSVITAPGTQVVELPPGYSPEFLNRQPPPRRPTLTGKPKSSSSSSKGH